MDINKKLIKLAIDARKFSYTPYSNFKVGASLLTKDDKIYTGCNIESVSLTPTTCGERTAFFKAISEGAKEFKKIVVVGGKNGKLENFCSPCGVCRQVMSEFVDENFEVILAISEDNYKIYNFKKDIFPLGFDKNDLK